MTKDVRIFTFPEQLLCMHLLMQVIWYGVWYIYCLCCYKMGYIQEHSATCYQPRPLPACAAVWLHSPMGVLTSMFLVISLGISVMGIPRAREAILLSQKCECASACMCGPRHYVIRLRLCSYNNWTHAGFLKCV